MWNIKCIPILIHRHGAISSWAQAEKSELGSSVCLFLMWPIKDFHLADISSSNPWTVEVTHQYRWFLTPLIQSLITSHPFSWLAFNNSYFLFTDLAKCPMSKKWVVLGWNFLIHFAIPLCRSDTKVATDNPTLCKKRKHRFAPSSSMALLLPVWFACWKNSNK